MNDNDKGCLLLLGLVFTIAAMIIGMLAYNGVL